MIGDRNVLAIIPARGGSKGIPRKNLVEVGGRPLIGWTIEAALQSHHLDRVILSSDDEEIIEAAVAAGCEAPFRRPASLASDEAGSVEVVMDALERVPGYDLFVLLQPTSPLRTSDDIDRALELLDESGADFCVSVTEAEDHPYLAYRRDPGGRLEPFCTPPPGQSMRRQDLPPAWVLNGAIFAGTTAAFVQQSGFLGAETVAYAMPRERSLDIDTPSDLRQLLAILGAPPLH